MNRTTLCFLVKEGKVLLAMKKRGFGTGKWNGVGGKVEMGENVRASAAREIGEEVGVTVQENALEYAANLDFSFVEKAEWDQRVSVFLIRRWEGEPQETEEMRPQWYPNDQLPFEKMWVDDPHWVPLVLAGKKIAGRFVFSAGGAVLDDVEVSEVSPLPSLA